MGSGKCHLLGSDAMMTVLMSYYRSVMVCNVVLLLCTAVHCNCNLHFQDTIVLGIVGLHCSDRMVMSVTLQFGDGCHCQCNDKASSLRSDS